VNGRIERFNSELEESILDQITADRSRR
jgi:hypothetical protein